MLDMQDAQRAVDLVRSVYRTQYAEGLDRNGVDEVYVFLDRPEFLQKFKLTYNCCFKAANNFTEKAKDIVDDVNAFVASDYRNFRRKIYIKNDPTLTWGTLVHEYVHYLTDRYLYPTCYERGGMWPDRIEGITEYLTRTASTEMMRIRTNYEDNYRQVAAYVGTSPARRQAVIDCCFKGETWKLGDLFPTS